MKITPSAPTELFSWQTFLTKSRFVAGSASDGFKGMVLRRDAFLERVAGDTAAAVAAHLGGGAVGIIKIPFVSGLFGIFDENHPIRADRAFWLADLLDEISFRLRVQYRLAIVDDDKIVAATAHFCKRNTHNHTILKG